MNGAGRVEYNTFEVDGSDVLNTSINASRGQGEPLMVYPSIDAIQGHEGADRRLQRALRQKRLGQRAGHDEVWWGTSFTATSMVSFAMRCSTPAITSTSRAARLSTAGRDYGGTIGGPLYIPGLYNNQKNKTFFFFSEEIRLEKTPVDYNQAVPTMAERGGDFSDVCPAAVPGGGGRAPSTQRSTRTAPRVPLAGTSNVYQPTR